MSFFCCFLEFVLELQKQQLCCVILTSKNIIRNLFLAFSPLLTFLSDYFWGFKKLNILLVSWQGPKTQLLHLRT